MIRLIFIWVCFQCGSELFVFLCLVVVSVMEV